MSLALQSPWQSLLREDVVRLLPQHLARTQHRIGEMGMVDGIRPDLGFQAEPGKGPIAASVKAGHGDLRQLEGGIKLDARLGGANLQRYAGMDAARQSDRALVRS